MSEIPQVPMLKEARAIAGGRSTANRVLRAYAPAATYCANLFRKLVQSIWRAPTDQYQISAIHVSLMCAASATLAAGMIILACAWPYRTTGITFDEAYNLVLARNFGETLQYATPILGTDSTWFDPKITTGPTVVVPNALLLHVTTLSPTVVPRLVGLSYLLLFVAAFAGAAWQLGGPLSSATALLLVAGTGWDVFELGVRALGEVASVTFIVLAVCSWAWHGRWSVLAGTFIGLAMLTKPQMLLAAFAFLIVLCSAERPTPRYRLAMLLAFVTPVGSWLAYQLVILGPTGWLKLNQQTLATLISSDYAGNANTTLSTLGGSSIVVAFSAVILLTTLWCSLQHRLPKILRNQSGVASVAAILMTAGFMRIDTFVAQGSRLLREHPAEACVSFVGLTAATVIGIRGGNPVLMFLGTTGLIWAEWSLGVSQTFIGSDYIEIPTNVFRYTFEWRMWGLLASAAAIGLGVRRALELLPEFSRTRTAALLSMIVAVVSVALVVEVQDRLLSTPAVPDATDTAAVAQWVRQHAPSDAVLLGDNWWMPWEVSYLTGRPVVDVHRSDLDRVPQAKFLALFANLSPKGFLDARTNAVVNSIPTNVVYQHGNYALYEWNDYYWKPSAQTFDPNTSFVADPSIVHTETGLGSTSVRWRTANGTLTSQVYVSANGQEEKLFGQGVEGEELATWIQANSFYEFRLYEGPDRQTLLASLTVVGVP